MSNDSDNNKHHIPPRPDAWASEVPEIKVAPGAPEIRVPGILEIRVSSSPEMRISGIPEISSDIPEIRLSAVLESRSVATGTLSVTASQVGWVETYDVPNDVRLDPLSEMKEQLEAEEKQLELLEKGSEIERRKRKYKKSDPAETWTSYWIASSIAYLYPAERREEWLGDLLEVNREMLHKGKPRWLVNLINFLQTLVLIKSALHIKLSDFISWGNQKSEQLKATPQVGAFLLNANQYSFSPDFLAGPPR